MDSLPIEKVIASLEGRLSEEEQAEVNDWLAESDENRNQYSELKKVVQAAGKVWINFQPDEQKALEKVHWEIRIKRIIRKTQLSAAAVLLTFFVTKAVMFVAPGSNWHQITSTERQVVMLPDSSKVVLAEHTNFKYPEKFTGEERVVFLKGQAYFEITHDTKRPFKVSMPETRIMVLGTRFFADATNPNKETVSVDDGEVFFYTSKYNLAKSVTVKANETGDWESKRDSIIKYRTPDPNAYSKISGYLTFENTPLSQVIRELEKHFHVKIQVTDEIAGKFRVSARLQIEDGIEPTLKLITIVTDLSIEKSGDTYLLKPKRDTNR